MAALIRCMCWCGVAVQTYPRVGRVVGNFYDAAGQGTAELAVVHEKAAEGKKIKVGGA